MTLSKEGLERVKAVIEEAKPYAERGVSILVEIPEGTTMEDWELMSAFFGPEFDMAAEQVGCGDEYDFRIKPA